MPSVHIGSVLATLRQDIAVAAQDCSATGDGAYTGELSAGMLADFGVKWVIVGHSERRTNQKESSALVATKTKAALDAGLSVMVCVGETLEEREAGKIDAVVLDDHMGALKGKFSDAEWAKIAIAYEPVWAIGTGLVIILGCVSVLVFVVRYMCISISIHPFILPYILTCMHECIFAHLDC